MYCTCVGVKISVRMYVGGCALTLYGTYMRSLQYYVFACMHICMVTVLCVTAYVHTYVCMCMDICICKYKVYILYSEIRIMHIVSHGHICDYTYHDTYVRRCLLSVFTVIIFYSCEYLWHVCAYDLF